MAMPPLTPDERQQLLDVLTSSEERFRRATDSLTADGWATRPIADKWSPAELAEHIALSEEVMPRLARKALAEPPAERDDTLVHELDREIIDSMKDDAWHGKAPEAIQPRRTFPDGQAAAKAFLERRARTMDYVRETDDPLRNHTFPHPAYGPIDGYQWLLMLAHHSDRHVRQIERRVKGEA